MKDGERGRLALPFDIVVIWRRFHRIVPSAVTLAGGIAAPNQTVAYETGNRQ